MRHQVGGRQVMDYLRMKRPEFLGQMRVLYPHRIEGLDMHMDILLRMWRRTKIFIPKPDNADRLYLLWILYHVPGLTSQQQDAFITTLEARPAELMQPILNILDAIIFQRATERDLALAANGGDTYTGAELEESMAADRARLHDFVRTFARLKRNQVDLNDETWMQLPAPLKTEALRRREAHIRAYQDTVDHPWLDETDVKGRKRTRGEKETIVTGLMNNGPQPRTTEDRRWRREDKKQRMEDVFNTIVTQHELIREQWDGRNPEAPITMHEEPNRFGRLEEDKGGLPMFPLYVKPAFAPVDHYVALKEVLRADALHKEQERARKARQDVDDEEEEWYQRTQ